MKGQLLYTTMALLAANLTTSQVLYSENFDNLAIGDLSTDLTPGKGNWFTRSNIIYDPLDVRVTNASTSNNILTVQNIINPTTNRGEIYLKLKDLDVLWNNRIDGNNVLKFEFDIYIDMVDNINYGLTIDHSFLYQQGVFAKLDFLSSSQYNNIIRGNYSNQNGNNYQPIEFDYQGTQQFVGFPNKTWMKVTFYFDYVTKKIHYHIPSLKIHYAGNFNYNFFPLAFEIKFYRDIHNQTATYLEPFVLYDNFNISAINSTPLSINKTTETTFNIFPNPVTDIVTIINNENIGGIEEVVVYDMNGKKVKSQKGNNNKNEVQLNMENFARGSYLLHVKTKEGTAIKKLIKN